MYTNKLRLDIGQVHQAFSPAREIQDPSLFVGRKEEIEKGITALQNPGGLIAIFGLRGVGKSSIAYQLKLISEGNTELPKMLNLDNLIPRKGFNHIVYYIRADGFIKSIPDLLKRILFGDESNPSLFTLTHQGDKRLAELKNTLEGQGTLQFFGAKAAREATYVPYVSDDTTQQFRQLLGMVQKDNLDRTGLLILIDEFDTIPDKAGFSSIVKTCSSDFVKFGTIGIGSNITELIQDHGSIGRQIDIIRVPLMPEHELYHILRRAEYQVGHKITYGDHAIHVITTRSEGFPYFTHLLGKEAMLKAFREGKPHIGHTDIEELCKSIAEGKLDTIYNELYHRAIKESSQREILLKLFSENEHEEILTEPIYFTARSLGITNPSQLMKELTTSESGAPVLTKVRARYYRFTDPVFKVYARMRNWKF